MYLVKNLTWFDVSFLRIRAIYWRLIGKYRIKWTIISILFGWVPFKENNQSLENSSSYIRQLKLTFTILRSNKVSFIFFKDKNLF